MADLDLGEGSGGIDDDELDNLLAGTGDFSLSQSLSLSNHWGGGSGKGAGLGGPDGGGGEISRQSLRAEAVKDDLFDI